VIYPLEQLAANGYVKSDCIKMQGDDSGLIIWILQFQKGKLFIHL